MSRNTQARIAKRECPHGASATALPKLRLDTEPPLGTHLVTERRGYCHHGIYVGNGKVVHYAGLAGSLHRSPVEEITIARFAAGHQTWMKPSLSARFVGEDAVRRARSRLGENCYRVLTNNCEHFCTWCLYGENRSEQIDECLAHPSVALRTAISLLTAFLGRTLKGGRSAACAA
jgi:hypothetical protein